MPGTRPIIVRAYTVSPTTTVAEAIDVLQKQGVRCLPVVDGQKQFMGWFSFQQVFRSILPAAVMMEGGLDNIDFVFGTAPGAAKKLRKIEQLTVAEVMARDYATAQADTPTWEMLRLLIKYGSPLPVVEDDGRFLGIISDQSVLSCLEEILKDLPAGAADAD